MSFVQNRRCQSWTEADLCGPETEKTSMRVSCWWKNVCAYEGKQQGVLEGRLREKWGINSNTVMLENRIERRCLFWGWLLTARDTLKKMKKWFLIKIKRWFTGTKSFWWVMLMTRWWMGNDCSLQYLQGCDLQKRQDLCLPHRVKKDHSKSRDLICAWSFWK